MSKARKEVLRSIHNKSVSRSFDTKGAEGEEGSEEDDEEEKEIDKAELKRKLDRASNQAEKERKKYGRTRDELKATNEKISTLLKAMGVNDIDTAISALESEDDDDPGTHKNEDGDSIVKKELKELRTKMNTLEKRAEEGDTWKAKAEELAGRVKKDLIHKKLSEVAAEAGVDPKRIGRFIVNVMIDYPGFSVDEDSDEVEYETSEGKYFTPEEIVEKFLETEDGKLFLPSTQTSGFNSTSGRGTPGGLKKAPKKGEIKTFGDYQRYRENVK